MTDVAVRARDSQRARLGKWETTVPTTYGLSLEDCERLTGQVARKEGLPYCPEIKDGRGSRRAAAFADGTIRFPRRHRDTVTVIHEITHLLVPAPAAAHGPEFVARYIVLLSRYLGMSRRELRARARRFRIKVGRVKTQGGPG